ncbi:uncharacterized protein PSFLO_02225 [Pseudozyma flocculosa]|uniref:Uncharacterized protein n=1 Tax=Pseudozyma flocculosa TaxID=84751 RepID=A0A5C3EWZ6_9BASI|nr:uncharacterized protein PSFLO_02225 [Pseudozyma flocculosa]
MEGWERRSAFGGGGGGEGRKSGAGSGLLACCATVSRRERCIEEANELDGRKRTGKRGGGRRGAAVDDDEKAVSGRGTQQQQQQQQQRRRGAETRERWQDEQQAGLGSHAWLTQKCQAHNRASFLASARLLPTRPFSPLPTTTTAAAILAPLTRLGPPHPSSAESKRADLVSYPPRGHHPPRPWPPSASRLQSLGLSRKRSKYLPAVAAAATAVRRIIVAARRRCPPLSAPHMHPYARTHELEPSSQCGFRRARSRPYTLSPRFRRMFVDPPLRARLRLPRRLTLAAAEGAPQRHAGLDFHRPCHHRIIERPAPTSELRPMTSGSSPQHEQDLRAPAKSPWA